MNATTRWSRQARCSCWAARLLPSRRRPTDGSRSPTAASCTAISSARTRKNRAAATANSELLALRVALQLRVDFVRRAVVRVVKARHAGAGLDLVGLLVGTGVERQRVAGLDRRDLPAIDHLCLRADLLAVDHRPLEPALRAVERRLGRGT